MKRMLRHEEEWHLMIVEGKGRKAIGRNVYVSYD